MKKIIMSFFVVFATSCKVQNTVITKDYPVNYFGKVWNVKTQRLDTLQICTFHRTGDWVVCTVIGKGKPQIKEFHWSAFSALTNKNGDKIEW